MAQPAFAAGDLVVYTKTKYGPRPGPRARSVWPVPQGEGYSYVVEKLWMVLECRPDGRLLVRTPRGKLHLVDRGDRQLRRATWWERLRYRQRLADLRGGSGGLRPAR